MPLQAISDYSVCLADKLVPWNASGQSVPLLLTSLLSHDWSLSKMADGKDAVDHPRVCRENVGEENRGEKKQKDDAGKDYI